MTARNGILGGFAAVAGLAIAGLAVATAAAAAGDEPARAASVALPVATAPTSVAGTDLSAVKDAVAAYRKGDLAAGDAARARLDDPAARALADYAAIRFAGASGGFDRVAAFAVAYPNFPGRTWLRARGEAALLADRKPAALVRSYFARERPQGAAGKLALALAFRQDGLDEDAAALVRDAWRNDVFGPDLEARMLDAFGSALTLDDHRFRTERLLLRENWVAARRAAGYANAGWDPLIKARVAVDGKAGNAAKLVDAVPAGLKRDTSFLFSKVQLLRRGDKADEAAKLLADLPRDPAVLADGDVWWVERRLVARELIDEGRAETAYEVAARHGTASAEKRVEAEFLAGWIALRKLNDPALARRHFDRAAVASGDGATPAAQARVLYWQGRAAEAEGGDREARDLFTAASRFGLTYYGQLAGSRVGLPAPAVGAAGDPGSKARQAAAREPMVGAVAVAYAADMRDLAASLAAEFGRGGRNVAELEEVASAALAERDARALLTLGKLAVGRGLRLDEAAFPTVGIPAFEPVGGPPVEPAMVHAIARQESAFDPAAGSGVGARGLMQMMPGTAAMTARKAGIEYEPGKLLDAVYNAKLGAAHLGDLMDDWRGSLILVFASYNAGPGNVRKWIAAHGDPRDPGVDPVDWVELIPFSETRNYVQRVLENLQVYRHRLDGEAPLLTERGIAGASRSAKARTPAVTASAADGPAPTPR